jgi:hypothetical protein
MRKAGNNASTCFLFVLIVASLIAVKPACAQVITNPSVPEFTLKFEPHPYYVPATITSYKDSAGETLTSSSNGYRDNNQTVTITIKNPSLYTGFNETYRLFYDVRIKDHVHNNWTDPFGYIYISDTEKSIVEFYFCNNPGGSQVDVQVQATIQNETRIYNPPPPFPIYNQAYDTDDFVWTPILSSGWSSTQTVNIPADVPLGSSPTPQFKPLPPAATQSPNTLPPIATQPPNIIEKFFGFSQLNSVIVVAVAFGLGVIIAVLVVVILFDRRIRILEQKQNDAKENN